MSAPQALSIGTKIGRFEVRQTLGVSTHGITYCAWDPRHQREVAIQEYLPVEFAERETDGVRVRPLPGKQSVYEDGLARFLQEARVLAQIHDPYVARLIEYTEDNGTAYLLTECQAGQTLAAYLERQPRLEEQELNQVLIPMLKGLRVIHSAGLLHRDITPSSIFLCDTAPPILMGFGSADRAVVHDHHSLDSRVTPGYSPIEQYHDGGELGPWTDLYALGATAYRCIAGTAPVDATKRISAFAQGAEDPLVPAMEIGRGDYSAGLLGNIDWMLAPITTDRPDSAGVVLGLFLDGQSSPPAARHDDERQRELNLPIESDHLPQAAARSYRLPYQSLRQPKDKITSPTAATKPRRATRGWTVVVAVLAAVIGFTIWRIESGPVESGPAAVSNESSAMTDQATTGSDTEDSKGNQTATTPAPDEQVNYDRDDDSLRAETFRELARNEQRIEQLLASAKLHLESDRLMFPPGENAVADYREVLEIEPGHFEARDGIDAILSTMIDRARTLFNEKDISQAEAKLDQVDQIEPDRKDAAELRRDIVDYRDQLDQQRQLIEAQRQREREERKQKVANHLRLAEQAMQTERYTAPAGNNAFFHFRAVLGLDTENAKALNGIKEIGRRYLDKAGQAIVNEDFDRGEAYLTAAEAVQADADTVSLLRKQLHTGRSNLRAIVERQQAQTRAERPEPSVEPPQQQTAGAELIAGIQAYYRGAYEQAFRLLNPLAQRSDARAQFRVGIMYNLGRGVAQNPELAEKWIRSALPSVQSAATSGEAWAQADLGSLYEEGLIVTRNPVEAARWYRLAAEQGYSGAQTNLGVMYATGAGVKQDVTEAVRWFRLAAAQGDKIARDNLATLGAN